MEKNALLMIQDAFENFDSFYKENKKFIWSQEKCKIIYRPHVTHYVKPLTIKDLNCTWQAYPKEYSNQNTFIIDDSPEKILHKKNLLKNANF